MDPGASQHVGRHTDLTPCLVLDPFAVAVFGRDDDEGLLESFDVDLVGVLGGGEAPIEVPTLLNEMGPLERVSGSDLAVDLVASRHEGLGAHLTTAAGPVLFERHEITAHRIPLAATLSKGVLVLVAESGLALGLSFPWRHTTSVVATDEKRNPDSIAWPWDSTMTTSWNHQRSDRGGQ